MCVESLTKTPISKVEAKQLGARALTAYAAYAALGRSNFTLENASGERVKILHALLQDAGLGGESRGSSSENDGGSDEALSSVASPNKPKDPLPAAGVVRQLVELMERIDDDDWDGALKSIAETLNSKFAAHIDALTTALRSSTIVGSARVKSRLVAFASEVERLASIDGSMASHRQSASADASADSDPDAS
jgi:hypothetical protein